MPRRRAVAVLLTALVVAGCGGDGEDDDAGGGAGTGASGPALEQDAQAKTDARTLATAVEACFVERQEYTGCTRPRGLGDVGDAEVATATATRFTVVSPSESGNEFRIVRSPGNGELARECDEPGEAGCPASGEW